MERARLKTESLVRTDGKGEVQVKTGGNSRAKAAGGGPGQGVHGRGPLAGRTSRTEWLAGHRRQGEGVGPRGCKGRGAIHEAGKPGGEARGQGKGGVSN